MATRRRRAKRRPESFAGDMADLARSLGQSMTPRRKPGRPRKAKGMAFDSLLPAIVFLGAIYLIANAWKSNPQLMTALLVAVAAIALLWFLRRTLLKLFTRRRSRGLLDIDQMTGVEFEEVCAGLFERKGYQVEATPATGDQGADLIAVRGTERTVVQTKCYSGSVGNAAVQEVVAALRFYGANSAIVVTNSYFTRSAIELARRNDVLLWDRTELSRMLGR